MTDLDFFSWAKMAGNERTKWRNPMYLFQETLTLHDKSLMSLAIKVGVCPLLWVAPYIHTTQRLN